MRDVFILLSLGLSVVSVAVCFRVTYVWFAEYRAYRARKHKSPQAFLIAGIFISFVGSLCDQVYWGLAWALEFVDHAVAVPFFDNGVYSNAFFRQWLTIYAGGLHIWAETLSRETERAVKRAQGQTRRIFAFSAIAGFAFVIFLIILRSGGI